uniref:ATP synthase complex subunit 8 n=1 Tax=Monema flavescens TaxID=1078814 RepID=A0A1L2JGS2_MONFL|nr:ATP synthase F0 subunit 8 [Monema flavescens]AOV94104.1 ATP synthase F0 subunit 8 [Monema flavescens]ATO90157.1 ATP synthase F0 subunit 8 [Monema flavescens]
MPQMMPINWLFFFFFFIIIFIIFNIFNYFIINNKTFNKYNNNKKIFKNLTWKW